MEACELVPHNCTSCGFWTATEISRTRAGWMRECTHCGNKAHAIGSARSFRLFSDALKRFREQACVQFPELARLTTRGAHIAFPQSG
ncbi:MAG: hypothetical protein ABIO49_06330 [Dokdonella sp.]